VVGRQPGAGRSEGEVPVAARRRDLPDGDRRFYRVRNCAFRRPLLAGAGSVVLYLGRLSVVEAGFKPFIYFQF
jgi:hypothetical protein